MKQTKENVLSKEMLRAFCQAAVDVGLLNLNEALVTAAADGKADRVQALLDGGADVHFSGGGVAEDEGLCYAAAHGHTEVVKILLAANANVHARNIYGHKDMPLRYAATGGHFEIVKMLVGAGASEFAWALDAAAAHPFRNKEVIEFLQERTPYRSRSPSPT